jgi:outer membrane protein TolC
MATEEHRNRGSRQAIPIAAVSVALVVLVAGCRSPEAYRTEADSVAHVIIGEAQEAAVGRTETLAIEPPSETLRRRLLLDGQLPVSDEASLGSRDVDRIPQWPDPSYPSTSDPDPSIARFYSEEPPLTIGLLDALQIAARNSREYQAQKESVFEAALRLDLERDEFRTTWTGVLGSLLSTAEGEEGRVTGLENSADLGLERTFETGASFALDLGIDLVKLLTQDKASSFGALADATLSIPLMRGSGRFVVREPLTQAERNAVYAVYSFERFKRDFAVRVANDYLGVLQQLDQVDNARESYERLVLSTRRARRLADAGELPEIQVDQARQDALSARNRWISAQSSYEGQLDQFKVLLGLPADAAVELERSELEALAERAQPLMDAAMERMSQEQEEVPPADAPVALEPASREGGGPYEIDEARAIDLAFGNRLDVRTTIGRVFDAQRSVAVAADQLRADLTLLGRATAGESRNLGAAGEADAFLDFGEGRYSALLSIDLPFERTAERNAYRSSLLEFEQAVRDVQELEDQVKLEIRDELRSLTESRESVTIQALAVEIARRRLDSTTMFLDAGRAEIRDVLDAESSLLSSQNALSSALVQYRVGELRLQRDMGVLEVTADGLLEEFVPAAPGDGE